MKKETKDLKERLRHELQIAKQEGNQEKIEEIKKEYQTFHIERRRQLARERAANRKKENKEILKDYFNNIEYD
jgi:hypothetical protein